MRGRIPQEPDERRDRDPQEPVDEPGRIEPEDEPENPLPPDPVDEPDDNPTIGEPPQRDPDPKGPGWQVGTS
ncbi:MAG TPA: hypothetical protein VHN15_09250 [Thermoanaerobaculia bacterium]|nr:hypothetical protein [Thermoanaerobaculia bacterium]